METKKIMYWKSDNFPNYIVRDNDGVVEEYKKGEGWIEGPEKGDVMAGIEPYYTNITEEEALNIISKLENASNN